MKIVSIPLVLLLIMLNSSWGWGLPPSKRYEYDNIESGHRKPLGLNTRFGPKYGGVPRGLGEHSNWCPLRAREALRLPAPTAQRLPAASRLQGPNYFNNPPDDNDAVRRYGRSQMTDSNVHQANNFNDANISDWDEDGVEDGVDVGGIFWPRRQIRKFDVEKPSKPDCGCHHDKIATLAKDATAAAANAATAAAVAARAAARAAAAAACGQDNADNHNQHDNPTDFNSDTPSEYSNNNDYQDEAGNFQDEGNFQGDAVNSQDSDNNRGNSGSEENSQGMTDNDDFSQGATKSEIDSLINTSSRAKRVMDFENFSQGMNNGQDFSKDNTKSDRNSRGNNGNVKNSKGDKNFKESTGNTEFSQGMNANEVAPWKNSNGGVNYGLIYDSNASQGTSGANSRRNAVNTQSAPGEVINSPGLTDSGIYPYNKSSATKSAEYSTGSNNDGNYSAGSRVVTSQRSNSTWVKPKDDRTVAGEDELRDVIKNNLTTSGLSNVQSIAPHVVRINS